MREFCQVLRVVAPFVVGVLVEVGITNPRTETFGQGVDEAVFHLRVDRGKVCVSIPAQSLRLEPIPLLPVMFVAEGIPLRPALIT